MLKQLYINNFTLIDTLDIKLNQGFSVITGETGAGKSIILGAINIMLLNTPMTSQGITMKGMTAGGILMA